MNTSKLKRAVELSPLAKKEIASRSGISPQALNSILEKVADPRVSTLEAIASTLGIKMSDLFDESHIEVKDIEHSYNSNADDIIKELTMIIKCQNERIQDLTNRLLNLK